MALLVLPVLMAGVLSPRLLALGTAAAVSLILLGTAWLGVLAGGDAGSLMTQAALASSGFFVISVLAGELAGRLAREELAARGNMEMARQQAALNRLVIEEMQDGVLVVDRRGRVRAANPAARRLLAPERHEPTGALPAARRGSLVRIGQHGGARLRRSHLARGRTRCLDTDNPKFDLVLCNKDASYFQSFQLPKDHLSSDYSLFE